jgi:hypothetical protein
MFIFRKLLVVFLWRKKNPVNKVERGNETSTCVIIMESFSSQNALQCILVQHMVRKDSTESESVYLQRNFQVPQDAGQALK